MLKIDKLFEVLDEFAPIELSHKLIEQGDYDNSGILIREHEEVNRVLFSLDFSIKAVQTAKRLKCDTIVTHHPAIYKPLSVIDGQIQSSRALLESMKAKMNVISMHLNLDVASGGIDACLCSALGGEKYKILEPIDQKNGYGREFIINGITLEELVKRAKKNLKTTKVTVYGKRKMPLKKGASFCGGGASHAQHAVEYLKTDADVIITSDLPHHVITSLVESGKCLIILTHYSSENYGFSKFFEKTKKALNNKAETFYFEDKRFL